MHKQRILSPQIQRRVKLLKTFSHLLVTATRSPFSVMSVCSVPQLCLTLCSPMDCSLPDSSVHGIFRARILDWVAASFSRGSSQSRDQTLVACIGRQMLYYLSHQRSLLFIMGTKLLVLAEGAQQKCQVFLPPPGPLLLIFSCITRSLHSFIVSMNLSK